MLKRKRIGMIVWGSILLCIGLYMLILSYAVSTESPASVAFLPVLIIGGMITAGGLLLIIFGIINAVKTSRYNNEVMRRNEIFTANCIYCGRSLTCTARNFRFHRRFPEGYTTCPYCKGNISRNAFGVSAGYQPYNNY